MIYFFERKEPYKHYSVTELLNEDNSQIKEAHFYIFSGIEPKLFVLFVFQETKDPILKEIKKNVETGDNEMVEINRKKLENHPFVRFLNVGYQDTKGNWQKSAKVIFFSLF